MHYILHQFIARRNAVRGKGELPRIGKKDVFSILQLCEQLVRLLHRLRQVFLPPGQNAQQQDFGRGAFLMHQGGQMP